MKMKALLTIISNSDGTFIRFRVNIRLQKSLLYFLNEQTNPYNTSKKRINIRCCFRVREWRDWGMAYLTETSSESGCFLSSSELLVVRHWRNYCREWRPSTREWRGSCRWRETRDGGCYGFFTECFATTPILYCYCSCCNKPTCLRPHFPFSFHFLHS